MDLTGQLSNPGRTVPPPLDSLTTDRKDQETLNEAKRDRRLSVHLAKPPGYLGHAGSPVPISGNRQHMSDPKEVAKHAHERAERAAMRAEAAHARAESLQRRRLDPGTHLEQAEEELRTAEVHEVHAKSDARRAHKQAADALEERADDLAEYGDSAGAQRAHARADEAREREGHT
jgi:hypothetical protein